MKPQTGDPRQFFKVAFGLVLEITLDMGLIVGRIGNRYDYMKPMFGLCIWCFHLDIITEIDFFFLERQVFHHKPQIFTLTFIPCGT